MLYIGDEILPSDMGDLTSHYEDSYGKYSKGFERCTTVQNPDLRILATASTRKWWFLSASKIYTKIFLTPEFGEVATKIPTGPFPPRNTCNAQRSELGPRPRWNFTVETERKRWKFRNATFQNPHGVMGWVELVGLGWLFWLVGLGWCWVEVGWVGWLGWLICLVGWVGWLFWLDWLGLQALKRRYPLKSYRGP